MKRVCNWRICPVLGRVVKEDFLEEASEDWRMNGVFFEGGAPGRRNSAVS